ncbi:MAG: fumarylacetoacetate hydrolase family protein [Frankia sp.]
MRLCTYRHRSDDARVDAGTVAYPGVIHGAQVTRLEAASLVDVLANQVAVAEGETYPLDEVTLLAPVPSPPSIRDFFAFEEHVATARRNRGQQVPPFWYDEPVFYFTNPAAVIGPDDVVAYPSGTRMLDYELEVAAVIGADERIAGFTIMNDWSARDVQRAETSVGLGPAKSKDFATSLGPVLVTVDEFDGSCATMRALVNGEELSRGELGSIFHSWDTIVERAARNTRLRPGEVLGSGTVGTGCLLELGDRPYLVPGDVVELSVEGIGVLRNVVGEPAPPGAS